MTKPAVSWKTQLGQLNSRHSFDTRYSAFSIVGPESPNTPYFAFQDNQTFACLGEISSYATVVRIDSPKIRSHLRQCHGPFLSWRAGADPGVATAAGSHDHVGDHNDDDHRHRRLLVS